jgi:hypothetical protein
VQDKNKVASLFDGWTETPAKRISGNITKLPTDMFLTDPITGRKLTK